MFFQVQRLVIVESTALFDTAGIDLKPHKAVKIKSKGKERGTLCIFMEHSHALFSCFTEHLCVWVQKAGCSAILSPPYWIRTRGGSQGLKCPSYCKGWDMGGFMFSPRTFSDESLSFFCLSQLISHIEELGLDTEGLLRIPGAATRVKVDSKMFDCRHHGVGGDILL